MVRLAKYADVAHEKTPGRSQVFSSPSGGWRKATGLGALIKQSATTPWSRPRVARAKALGLRPVTASRPARSRGQSKTRHPLHFGCVLSLRCRATWCWRCGMCATLGQATCSETPHPTGCSRLGTAEVDICRPRPQRSSVGNGTHQTSRVRLDGSGHHSLASPLLRRTRWIRGFAQRKALDAACCGPKAEGAARAIPHATPEKRNPRRARASWVEIGRNDRAAPEPVPG